METSAQNNSIGTLLIQISKIRRTKSNALLSEVGMHSGQDALLHYLSMEDGQTVSSLVKKLCIQHATISNMIDRMIATGLIRKEKDQADKRTSRVYLTNKGKEAISKIRRAWGTIETLTIKGLSLEDENKLRDLLQHILKNLR